MDGKNTVGTDQFENFMKERREIFFFGVTGCDALQAGWIISSLHRD